MNEAPLDAANQSLSDALQASFWVLKIVMLFVVGVFLFSGVFMVDEREVAVLTTFGKPKGEVRKPGLHWAWPYPIDEVIRVSTTSREVEVFDFWLKLNETEKHKARDQLRAKTSGLNPAVDGALITADQAIMHASFWVQYTVPPENAIDYVANVEDDKALVKTVIKQAAVAEAARTAADVVWRHPTHLAHAVRLRAQRHLDEELNAGILLEDVAIPESHYPLQAAPQFLAVNNAESRKRELINEAQAERERLLNGIAGTAWEKIHAEIEKLDLVENDQEREEIIGTIRTLMANEATGEVGGKIRLAQRDRERIINDTLVEVRQFEAVLDQYRRNPDLVRLQLNQAMRQRLFTNEEVIKWVLPPGSKQLVFWLNKDPKETAEAERTRMEKITGNR